jgi:uncharacterized protein (DUF2147 family)
VVRENKENNMITSSIRKELALILMTAAMLGTALSVLRVDALNTVALAQDKDQLIGNWSGDSVCQVKGSSCRDEKVVYHIVKGSDAAHVTVSADKIVNGKAINMGTGDYTYDRENGTLVNETEGRVWKFIVKGRAMEGTLTMPDKMVYRRVTLTRNG